MREFSVIVLLVSLSVSSFGWASGPTQNITNTTVMSLALADSAVRLGISHPGSIVSGVCGIEIRTDRGEQNHSIRDLYNALAVENKYPTQPFEVLIPNDMTISIQLAPPEAGQFFVAGVSISTQDGKSLRDTIIATLGQNRKVIVIGTTCKE